MMFAFSVAELHIPGARSLKEKRSVVRRLTDRLHHRYKISIAETDHQNLHQRVEIAVALVHRDGRRLEHTLSAIEETLASCPDATLVAWKPELFEPAP